MRVGLCVFAVGVAALFFLACPSKRCTTPADCLLDCDCEDPNNNVVVKCGLQYRCDFSTDLCSEAFNTATCDDVCNLQPDGKCYSRQCISETDCLREVQCNVDPGNGMIQTLPCTMEFACDADDNLCEVEFTATDLEVCQMCQQAGVFG